MNRHIDISRWLAEDLLVGSGSYNSNEVTFLLKQVELEPTDLKEKERLIQSGKKHYSEMISLEQPPSEQHLLLFNRVLTINAHRMAVEIQSLASKLKDGLISDKPIILVSLVRAGVPLGVLLKRALSRLNTDCYHYGISIIRDRGIDTAALNAIINAHGSENIVFVDGWTGKGAISTELEESLAQETAFIGEPRLVVLADPCGKAWLAASAEDWIIPSGILGATVSGLISRSIWPDDSGIHSCIKYENLAKYDISQEFINQIEAEIVQLKPEQLINIQPWTTQEKAALQEQADGVIKLLAEQYQIDNLNRIKPGIAEATRAVMRRVPEQVLVRDKQDADVELLINLANKVNIKVQEVGDKLGPYRAITIIKKIG